MQLVRGTSVAFLGRKRARLILTVRGEAELALEDQHLNRHCYLKKADVGVQREDLVRL
jgi:hypothetical protein